MSVYINRNQNKTDNFWVRTAKAVSRMVWRPCHMGRVRWKDIQPGCGKGLAQSLGILLEPAWLKGVSALLGFRAGQGRHILHRYL